METEDTAESSDMSNSIFVTETLWRALNNPLITIFSDLDNPGTEHTLKLLLDSMLRSSCNLVIVLLPPFDSGGNYENLRMQHTAYTTWLFGILFHVVGAPLSELVLNKSVQVQACMLRILARLDVLMFNLISSEYMRIFDELLDWSKNKEEDAPKTFEKFIVDRNAIENLDLPHFPVTIEASRISVTQISIMNIIMKTGVSCFDEAEIWNRIHRVMEISEPEAKLLAIKVASEIIEFCTVDAKDSKIFVTRATEVMNLNLDIAKHSYNIRKNDISVMNMNFNEKQLSDTGKGPAEIEGRLNHKRSHKSVFKERWFKLRCNLLFYFNINEFGQIETKPAGLIVLENYIVKPDAALQGEFAFSIIFRDEQEKRHVLTGRSEFQVDEWVTALRRASYEFWRSKLVTLQERLCAKTGKDPLLMYPRNQGTVRDEAWESPMSFKSHVSALQTPIVKKVVKEQIDLIDFS